MSIKRVVYYITFTCFYIVFTADIKVRDLALDIGQNLTLECTGHQNKDVMWVREGREYQQISRLSILRNASLFLAKVDPQDAGIYSCTTDDDQVITKVKVKVRTTPPPLANVTVHPSTILALILWDVPGETGGYPIIDFTAQYKLTNSSEDWKPISPNRISPNCRQIDVYKLEPNTTYSFRVWATNHLGKGEITEVEARTRHVDVDKGVDNFDTRIWLVAVGVVLGTLVVLGFGTCLLLYQECRSPSASDEQEIIELVPNIILNPGFDNNTRTERIPADENSNSETTIRLNNNTVVQPRNM